MKIIKNRLHNQIEDQWLNDSLIIHIESDRFNDINNYAITQRFQKNEKMMRTIVNKLITNIIYHY